MAKVRLKVGEAWVEVDAVSVKDAIQEISDYVEVFGEGTCGLCQSPEIVPRHRRHQDFDFYEMACLACGATLSYGQTKEGGRLFPKRKDRDGNEIGKQGWHQYQATQQGGDW